MDVVFFKSSAEFHTWLEVNHTLVQEVWVGFYKKGSGETGVSYHDAVDQALCFGWIDGIRKTVDESSYTIRFTPRKAGSIWSSVNIKRAGELVSLGQMHAAGLKAFAERSEDKTRQYSYEQNEPLLSSEYEQRFKANPTAWDFFQAQPPYYRKTATWYVISAKREETRLKRLMTLIEDSQNGRRLAQVTYNKKD